MNKTRTLTVLALFASALVFPLVWSNPAVTTIAVFTLTFAAAAVGWNVFSGYTGYLSLGHAAFYGFGAYALTFLCQLLQAPGGLLPFFLLPVAGLLTGICALPLGWVALKTRRHVFMVLSIAIYALCAQLPDHVSALSTSMAEISLPIPGWSADAYNLPFYYASLVLVLVALGISWSIRHSKYGLGLLAIRDDEDRAQGLGVNVGAYKLGAYVLSGVLVGMAGALNAYFLGFISPTSAFDRSANIALPLMAFLGGVGTVSGPLLGALIEVPLQQYLTMQVGTQGWDLVLAGFMFLLVIRFLPEGLMPSLVSRRLRWMVSSGQTSTGELLPVLVPDLEGVLAQPSGVPDPPETQRPSVLSVTRQPYRIPSPMLQYRQVQATTGEPALKVVRAPRLVPIPQAGSPPIPKTSTIPPTDWPCPRCGEPLLSWGDSRFCTRCGYVLTTTTP
jgi:branched-chain amino acid transport system permease protein